MKISLNWIKDYVDINVSLDKLVHKLTMAGLEVEHVETVGRDKIIELEITPNRADCLNMIGMSREISAVLNTKRKPFKIKNIKWPSKKTDVTIEDQLGCRRYIGTVVEGVNIKTTPEWIKKRIGALGLRSVNNIVDITNFVLLETGQPLHAFDRDKIIGDKIIVRRAKKGEKILAIDDTTYELDPSILVIADAKRPIAIAGIMGGKDTEVTKATKNILLESAYFDPVLTRRASRKLGLSSDSSYRFERGVDYLSVEAASQRALGLILEFSGGMLTKHRDVQVKTKKTVTRKISLTLERINSYLGTSLTLSLCKNILKKLDIPVSGEKSTLRIAAPSFRSDLKQDVDVIEEIARVIGYDNLPSSMPRVKFTSMRSSPQRENKKTIKRLLTSQGFNEVITFSMISEKDLIKSKQDNLAPLRIINPLTQDQTIMQPSLLPGMLSIVKNNLNKGQKALKFFQLGSIYTPKGEQEALAIMLTGKPSNDWRLSNKPSVDYFDLKGALEQVFLEFSVDGLNFISHTQAYLETNESVQVSLGKTPVGYLGAINDEVLKNWGIKEGGIYFLQMILPKELLVPQKAKTFVPISEYPVITRDVSLAIKNETSFQDVQDRVFCVGKKLLQSMSFAELYQGDKIPTGFRGITFSLTYQSNQRTLREEEVNTLHQRVVEVLVDELGAVVR